MFFVSFLHDLKKHWPGFCRGFSFLIKFFSRRRRDITFIIILFLTTQKKYIMHFTDLQTKLSLKTFKYFFKKKFSIFFTCFLCHFYMTWKNIGPGFCRGFSFLIKFFSRLRRDITFIILFLTTQKNTSCISLTFKRNCH